MVKRLASKANSAQSRGVWGHAPRKFLKFSCPERPYLSDFQPKNSVSVYNYCLQLINANNYVTNWFSQTLSLACSHHSSSSLSEPKYSLYVDLCFAKITLR